MIVTFVMLVAPVINTSLLYKQTGEMGWNVDKHSFLVDLPASLSKGFLEKSTFFGQILLPGVH